MTKPTGRPVGRPKTKEYSTLLARVPQDLVDRVKRYKSLHRLTIADLIRDGLEWRITEGDPRSALLYDMNHNGHYSNTEMHEMPLCADLLTPVMLDDEELSPEPSDTAPADDLDAIPFAPETPPVDMPKQTGQLAPLLVPGLAPVPADTPRAQRRARLLSAVPWDTDTPGGMSPADIRRATGISKVDAANDLDELRKHGQVVKVSKGLYARPGPAPSTQEN